MNCYPRPRTNSVENFAFNQRNLVWHQQWWSGDTAVAMGDNRIYSQYIVYLVGGLEHEWIIVSYIENNHPNWLTHIFRGVGLNHQPDSEGSENDGSNTQGVGNQSWQCTAMHSGSCCLNLCWAELSKRYFILFGSGCLTGKISHSICKPKLIFLYNIIYIYIYMILHIWCVTTSNPVNPSNQVYIYIYIYVYII